MEPEQFVVVVVDDDPSIRDSLRRLLESVGLSVADYASAQEFLERQELERVGCLILDVRMPGLSGLDLQDRLHARGADLPIVFLTGHGDVPMAVRAMRAGAIDFLEKPFNQQQLLDRVHQALQGSTRRRQMQSDRAKFQALLTDLTRREREVLDLMVSGKSNKDIALLLDISRKTLDIHRAKVLHKIGVENVPALVSLAWRFIPPNEAPALPAYGGGRVDGRTRAKPEAPAEEKPKRKRGRPRKQS